MTMTAPTPSPRPVTATRGLAKAWRLYWPDLVSFAGALITAALAALLLGSLHGCGGGVGSEGTGSFASGPITGFGSVVVNGVRFNDDSASVLDDDGAALDRSRLALGSVVEVTGERLLTASDGSVSAVASKVQLARSLVGPVTAVDAPAGTLVVLGQTVRTNAQTVMDAALRSGLAGLALYQVVEVHAAFDAGSASFVASRLALSPLDGATWRVRGPVSGLDSAAKSFRIGSQTYSFSDLAGTTAVAEGQVVQLALKGGTDGQGRWLVSKEKSGSNLPKSNTDVELSCVVAQLLSSTRFVASGVTVDTSTARVSGTVQQGSAVQVSGQMVNGVLVATQVSVQKSDSARAYELKGQITAVNLAARTLQLRNTTVSLARSDLQLVKGSLADLVVGRRLEVRGELSADRTVLEATRIEFAD